MLTRESVDTLLGTQAQPAVTLYMPSLGPSLDLRQNPIRLGNLLDEAARRLSRRGWPERRVADLLSPARDLVTADAFWADGSPGLAIFLAEGFAPAIWRVPDRVEEQVVVGSRFHLAPLLRLLEGDDDFLLLTVSANRTRLFRGNRFGLDEVADHGLPESVEETVRSATDYEPNQHENPIAARRSGRGGNSGSPGAVPNDQALGLTPEELRKSEMLHFLELLGAAFDKRWGSATVPVVLAALPETAGNLMPRIKSARLPPRFIGINPDALDLAELHRRAFALVEPDGEAQVDAVLDHFNSLYGDRSPRASVEPADLVRAARWGRLDTLILAEGEHVWGHFDEDSDRVETHATPEDLDDDLLDLAAQQTLLKGGAVRVVARDRVPSGARCAGILRY